MKPRQHFIFSQSPHPFQTSRLRNAADPRKLLIGNSRVVLQRLEDVKIDLIEFQSFGFQKIGECRMGTLARPRQGLSIGNSNLWLKAKCC